ncbi:Glutamate receptor 2 [Amphibalanus amphitrite]|uniref:Glutamate receptor 2 n=1 Tax=Amphibalanus amphitrite TaxID=1232801 RepID=A0A6A4VEU6_AMPAM|nr:Glutamate receptor 2 [Amphibalanus amphitrite]
MALVLDDSPHLAPNSSLWAGLEDAEIGTVRVAALHDPPYFYIERRPDGTCCQFDGFLWELWQLIAQKARLQYEITPLLGAGYGQEGANGSWTGLVGELVHGRADVALSWLGMFGRRQRAVAFLDAVPVSVSRETFYVARGATDAPRLTAAAAQSLLAPLGADVWWALLASLLVLAVALRVTVWLSRGSAETPHTVAALGWVPCLLACFGTVVRQGWSVTPDSLSARTVTCFCWALSTVIHASYTANLMSQLVVERPPAPPITSLRQFLDQPDWTFSIPRGHGMVTEWAAGGDAERRALALRVSRRDRHVDLESLPEVGGRLDRVLVYGDSRWLRDILGPASCQLTAMSERLPAHLVPTYMAVTRRLPALRVRLNAALLATAESGLLNRLRTRWLTEDGVTCAAVGAVRPLSLADLVAVLALVPLAVAVSGGLFVLEWLWSRMRPPPASREHLLPTVGNKGSRKAWYKIY